MKHFIVVLLVLGAVGAFFGCQENGTVPPYQVPASLDKPAPTLTGDIVTVFDITKGPEFWQGTITFSGATYGLTFVSHDPPRDFSAASLFTEELIFYELGNRDNVYFHGWHDGAFVTKIVDEMPLNFVANGVVDYGSGPFEGWEGRRYYCEGLVTWDLSMGLPAGSTGTVRLN